MNGLTARWSFRLNRLGEPAPGPGEALPFATHGASALATRLLCVRGITNATDAAVFLDPKLNQLHDPSLIPDLDRAAERLVAAIRAGERIVIYGDYDVDGVTATAILYHLSKHIDANADVHTYVPHRLDEGYGLNSDAIREIAGEGTRVIVTVDCGVTAVEQARVARELGVDLIITDHHHPPEREEDLPLAYAVVHPRRPGSRYPFGELCGAGVAYKLAWRMATVASGATSAPGSKVGQETRELLVELLAFAALGTIADVVPLVGENRVLARFGLVRAKHSPFTGLKALVEASGLTGADIGEMEVGFALGPRLNAAGRMGHAKDAVELFTTASGSRATEIATLLSAQNTKRRAVEKAIFETACEMVLREGMDRPDRRAIVLAHEDWHAGVVGIACSRLVEKFHRPTILMQKKDGVCHGSGRSIDGFNLHAGLTHCAEHLEKYGGHTMAAGLHIVEPKLPAFVDRFTEYANGAIAENLMCASVQIDCEATAAELTPQSIAELDRLGPFGASNPQPQLLVRDLRIVKRAAMGAGGKHLQLWLRTPDAKREWRAVAWNWGEKAEQIPIGESADVVMRPRVSTFTGSAQIEPQIVDIALIPHTSGR